MTAKVELGLVDVDSYYLDKNALESVQRAVRDSGLRSEDVVAALTEVRNLRPWQRNVVVLGLAFCSELSQSSREFLASRASLLADVGGEPVGGEGIAEGLCAVHVLHLRDHLELARDAASLMVERFTRRTERLDSGRGLLLDMVMRSSLYDGSAFMDAARIADLAADCLRDEDSVGASAVLMHRDEVGVVASSLASPIMGGNAAKKLAFARLDSSAEPIAIIAKRSDRASVRALCVAGLLGIGSEAGAGAAKDVLERLAPQDWADATTAWRQLPPEQMGIVACGVAEASDGSMIHASQAIEAILSSLEDSASRIQTSPMERDAILRSLVRFAGQPTADAASQVATRIASGMVAIEDLERLGEMGYSSEAIERIRVLISHADNGR